MRAFEQAAEIFFAGLVQRALFVAEVGHGFIFHREPLQLHDAEILLARFPDLSLTQFHRYKKSVSPDIVTEGDSI